MAFLTLSVLDCLRMDAIDRRVRDRKGPARVWLEAELGEPLRDNEQVFIMVYTPGVEPNANMRSEALQGMREFSEKAYRDAQERGLSVIDDTIDDVRHHK